MPGNEDAAISAPDPFEQRATREARSWITQRLVRARQDAGRPLGARGASLRTVIARSRHSSEQSPA
jgi:hypothetical protein